MARPEISANARQGFNLPRARRPLDDHVVIDLTRSRASRPLLIIHSSDDMYGADRMLLEVIGALGAEDLARLVVWLPADYTHGTTPLCEHLKARGIQCEHVDLPVLRRRYLNAGGLSAMGGRVLETRRRLALLDPSDIILATSAVLPIAPFIGRRGSTRVSLYVQEMWQRREGRVLGGLAARVDRVVAISDAVRGALPEYLQERAVVVPNATSDPTVITPLAPRPEALTYVVAGRWTPGKGYGVLIKAWDEAGCPGTLVILGGPPAMGTAVDVPAMVRRSRRPGSIRVVGEVQDVSTFIDAADVMVVPSTTPEGFGLVTIEAFAHGRPVIASACGGSLETVRDGAGWLVAPGDVSDLARTLQTLTRSAVVEAGAAARSRFEARYSRAAFRAAMREALQVAGSPAVEGGAAQRSEMVS